MSFRDQQKYLDELKKHVRNFDRKESDDFKMFLKRHKDEDEFDSVSMKRLKEIYDKYIKPVDKSKYDSFFRKKGEE
jgi:ribosome recycling factor